MIPSLLISLALLASQARAVDVQELKVLRDLGRQGLLLKGTCREASNQFLAKLGLPFLGDLKPPLAGHRQNLDRSGMNLPLPRFEDGLATGLQRDGSEATVKISAAPEKGPNGWRLRVFSSDSMPATSGRFARPSYRVASATTLHFEALQKRGEEQVCDLKSLEFEPLAVVGAPKMPLFFNGLACFHRSDRHPPPLLLASDPTVNSALVLRLNKDCADAIGFFGDLKKALATPAAH